MICAGCDKDFRSEDLAPYQRNPDVTFTEACRHCITSWVKEGFLWRNLQFWARKEGLDR
jgi:hypothetical protein